MSSHLRAEDHPTTRVIPEPSQRSRAGRLPPPRGDPAAEHYSHPIFWRETMSGFGKASDRVKAEDHRP